MKLKITIKKKPSTKTIGDKVRELKKVPKTRLSKSKSSKC